MREVLTIPESEMESWRQICRAYAKKVKAKLLFVNNTSMGLAYPDGSMKHVYVDELKGLLGG